MPAAVLAAEPGAGLAHKAIGIPVIGVGITVIRSPEWLRGDRAGGSDRGAGNARCCAHRSARGIGGGADSEVTAVRFK
jgi:hypothetical protein